MRGLGLLMWETEIVKLGILRKMVEAHNKRCNTKIEITTLLGKSLKSEKTRAIPVFSQNDTLYVFEDFDLIIKKMSQQTTAALLEFRRILLTILRVNYPQAQVAFGKANGLSIWNGVKILHGTIPNLDRPGLEVIALLKGLRRVYGVGDC
jgi:hypothetical protein